MKRFRDIPAGTRFAFTSMPNMICGKLSAFFYTFLVGPNAGKRMRCNYPKSPVIQFD